MPTINPWALLAIGAAWIASLIMVGSWQNKVGHESERLAWVERDNEELTAANNTIERLTREARQKEADHATRLAAISETHQEELQHAKAQRDRDVAAARSGAIRLRYQSTPGIKADSGTRPEAGPASCGRDGETPSELPGEIAANLYSLAHDADDTARQLAACQQVILEDRRLCNGE